jgi:hypothetical protein
LTQEGTFESVEDVPASVVSAITGSDRSRGGRLVARRGSILWISDLVHTSRSYTVYTLYVQFMVLVMKVR